MSENHEAREKELLESILSLEYENSQLRESLEKANEKYREKELEVWRLEHQHNMVLKGLTSILSLIGEK